MAAAGIYGIAFSPYVGPWVGDAPVLFNTYTVDQVTQLLTPVAKQFSLIATYGQGTFVWQNVPNVQDSNRYNIQAARNAGLKVSAGCFQQGANAGADSINVDWTKAEIDYALDQAKIHGNVVELVIGNECLWGPNSTEAIVQLIDYAKSKRAPDFNGSTLPITTRQRWDVLGGVNNASPDYAPMRQAMLQLLAACEGFVYANMYAYFDPNIASQIGPNATQSVFTGSVTNSMNSTMAALRSAFSSQNVSTEIRIGETGWPTQGSQPTQPNVYLANAQYAAWYYEAMKSWSVANGVKTILFEAYDEPWKGSADGSNSEASFGMWQAEGSAAAGNQYALTGEKQKYPI